MIQAVIFLGNPGKQYNNTRHNLGWMLADEMLNDSDWTSKFKGLYQKAFIGSKAIHCLKPATFMNKSGESVIELVNFFKLSADQICVVHDDLELSFDDVQLRQGGGLGGHNGLKSIKQVLKDQNFYRLRMGIGRPQRGDVSSFVLGRFSKEEEPMLPQIIYKAEQALKKGL